MFSAASILFVPGSRADRFGKARAAGAGVTVIDLEDAVPAGDKESARDAALAEMQEGGKGWAIRLNALTTPAGIADLDAMAKAGALPQFIFLTMVESASEPEIVARVLGDRCPGIIPTIETPRGLAVASHIASAPGVSGVMFGGGDFSAELGVELAWEPLLAARQQLILACAEARVPAIDVPWIHMDDADGLAEECMRARAIGFAAKAAIHPKQVGAIESAFAPSVEEVTEAEEALAAFADAGEKVIRHRGRMLEAPIIKQYRAVIARSKGLTDA